MTKRPKEVIELPEMDYFMDEDLSDVVFVIDGHRVPALKHILSLKSRVFRAMFSGNFSESKESDESKLPKIEIKDTTFDAFKTLIRFIYTEQLVLKDDNDLEHICDVYQLSDRYEVIRLRQKVGRRLKSRINFEELNEISRVVFNYNIEDFMTKVMTFIEENINELIRRDIEELKQLNESTNDKLLNVLTGDRMKPDVSLKRFVVEEKTVFIKKDALIQKGLNHNKFFVDKIKRSSLNVFKTLIGYLYFDKLILKDEEDFEQMFDLCWFFFLRYKCQSFFDYLNNHLKDRITVDNLESISNIAFTFVIEELMQRIKTFIKQNFTEIFAKSDEQLSQINRSSDDTLMIIISNKYRKSLQTIDDLRKS